MRLFTLLFLLLTAPLLAAENPFEAPEALKSFAQHQTRGHLDVPAKLSHLVRAFFAPVEEGGLGMTYDNSYTRTVSEGYRDRKANCFTMTAMYIACGQSIGVDAQFAESLRISHWRRAGATILYERHYVAVMGYGSIGLARVADFLPEVRQGVHRLVRIHRQQALAVFFSNRAVELLNTAHPKEALASARTSVEIDPSYGGGWNVLGVVLEEQLQVKEAEFSFCKAMSQNTRDGISCGNLEWLLLSQGREKEAQACRDRALETCKKNPYYNAFLAQEALSENQWDEAEKRMKVALGILPHEPEFLLIHARICLAQGLQ